MSLEDMLIIKKVLREIKSEFEKTLLVDSLIFHFAKENKTIGLRRIYKKKIITIQQSRNQEIEKFWAKGFQIKIFQLQHNFDQHRPRQMKKDKSFGINLKFFLVKFKINIQKELKYANVGVNALVAIVQLILTPLD